jgi:pimeloyl-ACP methyl ester carboxylesterase
MATQLKECRLSNTEILRYRVHGHGPTTAILLHGLASRSECWNDLVPLFPPERYTLYLLDLLGSGGSSKPKTADYSIRAHSRRLLRFLEQESLTGVTLVGHSLGGAVVLVAAIEAMLAGKDADLASVVIMSGPGFMQRLPLIAEVFQKPLAGWLFVTLYAPDAYVRIGLEAAYYDQSLVDPEHISRYAPCYKDRDAKRALVETCRSLVPEDHQQIIAHYRDLRLPVLLLWGRHDSIVPLSQGTRLAEAIPGAKLVILEECGHNPQEEKPEETFSVIDSFVTKTDPTGSAAPVEIDVDVTVA